MDPDRDAIGGKTMGPTSARLPARATQAGRNDLALPAATEPPLALAQRARAVRDPDHGPEVVRHASASRWRRRNPSSDVQFGQGPCVQLVLIGCSVVRNDTR